MDLRTVVIGRSSLWRALEAADEGAGANVIAVKGEPGSGKTWSRHVITMMARHRKHRIANLDVKPDLSCEVIAHRLLDQIGNRDRVGSRDNHPGVRWGDEVGQFVAARLPAEGDARWWIIVDGCGQASHDVKEMLSTLGTQVRFTRADTVRLCLLGYGPTETFDENFHVDVTTRTIPEGEIRAFFARAFETHAGIVDDAVVTTATDIVLQHHRTHATHDTWLRTLHDITRDAIGRLFRGGA